mmetsp:Transcript_4910/g.13704  ORF Transcript_4910/g.13704 Transcript_4910/m.13704 type:complete len:218 (+) Transcript_4910:1250-1903(+)
MVRPPTRQLSALKFPWQKPTRSQSPISAANRPPKVSSRAAARASIDSCSCRMSGYSRNRAWLTIFSSSSRCRAPAPSAVALLEKRSMWPTRRKLGATRVVMAHGSSIRTSGSLFCFSIARRRSAGTSANLGSSSVISLYQGRCTVSLPETTRDRARVVSIPRLCMASEARNSRMEERRTARPSALRQKGVWPPPLSCISHLLPLTTTSPTETALPSP